MDPARRSESLANAPAVAIPHPRWPSWRAWGIALATLAALVAGAARGIAVESEDPRADVERLKFFEAEVRPLLAAKCFKCHGPEKQKGGLRLDSRDTLLTGGDGGPAVVPGKPEESLLIEAIDYASDDLKMPPNGQLTEAERATLTRWVKGGAPWPAATTATPTPVVATASKPKITEEDRAFWSFQPLRRPDVPAAADSGWSRNPIDRFVFARLAAAGLTPAPEEDRRALFRRLAFDLTGLPPEPEQLEAFVADRSPEAYEALVDRLLASPRYGERWGRHWLDLVRYAESDGYRADAYRPDAWRYRDYVIKALNEDRPYDRFVAEQLAGDELDPADPELRVAAGFFRLGTYEHNQRDVPGQWSAILNDITDVAGDVFLGLGIGCARCHDHKFDPILQKDYYRLQAFFAPILPRDDLDLATPAQRRRYEEAMAAWNARTVEIRQAIAELERPYREKAAQDAITKFPPETQAILARPAAERTPLEQQLAELAFRQVTQEEETVPAKVKKSRDKAAWEALQKQLARHDRDRPEPLERVLTVTDVGPVAPVTIIPGDRSRQPVEPGFLTLLDPAPAPISPPPSAPGSTGRRTVLARWLTRPDNPLSTRVVVNRIWQYHFGRGLVGTSSDFGRLGERPSHPELLDWLASEFVARGWSLKQMHWLILTSATYRQAAAHPSPQTARRVDPENRLLWHASIRRLDAEPIRDAMLAVSGELDPAMGGPSVEPSQPRRTVYAKVKRNTHDPLNEVFDAPDGSITTPRRDSTVTPLQALLMINGPWTLARARAFATRIEDEAPDDRGRIERAYRLAFGRGPTAAEQAEALAFLRNQARATAAAPDAAAADGAGADCKPADASDEFTTRVEGSALIDFCHALLNSNEFLYVD